MADVQTEYTTADAIVQELVHAGVEVAFGIVSIHNMPIYDAILREGSIHLVCSRGESGAVNMADGYARSTGKLGVVITSTGTGAGNAAGSIIEAWAAGVPLLHLTGEVGSKYLGTGRGYIHECKDQLSMMKGSGKEAYRLRNPEQAPFLIRKAIHEAFAIPSGPITVEVPIDFQTAIIHETSVVQAHQQVAETSEVLIPDAVIESITEAKRPVLWVGGGAISANASEEVQSLAEKIGAAVITSQSGKGIIPEDHDQCFGHFGAHPETKKFLEKADLLISVGVRFRGNETSNWAVTVPENHIGIDGDYEAMNRNYPLSFGLVGDAKQTLKQINEKLMQQSLSTKKAYLEEVKSVRNNLRDQLRSTLGPYEKILDSMRELLPRDTIHVRDVTVPANVWGSRLLEIYEPRNSIHASGGGIGQGLPTAIGAQIANRDRQVVLIAGDGGFMVNVGELATAVQEKIPLIIVLFDDSGYGVLRSIQDAAYGRQVAVDLVSPDFALLGQSMGAYSKKVTTTEEFSEELKDAVYRKETTMIIVDMNAIGPMNKPFAGPPGVAATFKPKKL
ncbi:thiamine pyrophosphate-binding protein [Bacillus sp. FJAT-45350]|uniref:thiamine pyrophosphate-binding protein n=1 Tax=Bacillus sp. FJAT-45350 TaxID=2011014 RepID=UPI000BB7E8F2|nr:thiamine pyrophosphate-binding protein [Bacillus sp. FJAT-45350]